MVEVTIATNIAPSLQPPVGITSADSYCMCWYIRSSEKLFGGSAVGPLAALTFIDWCLAKLGTYVYK